MNDIQRLTIANIEAQVKSLLGTDVKVKFDDEDEEGTAIRFEVQGYSPEIDRYYGEEIKSVDKKDLIAAYAIAFGSIPADNFLSKKEMTTVFLPKVEGCFKFKSDTWYKLEREGYGIPSTRIPSEYTYVRVSGSSSGFFKPNTDVRVKVSKELVWGLQHDNDWEFYSSWSEDREIDPDYNVVVGNDHYYAKQNLVWKAEVIS